jgi:hypothetical protein
MKLGPETERALALVKQLPTPSDAIVGHEEGRRLHYLRQHPVNIPLYGFLLKILAGYGESINCPSLRLAALSFFDYLLPFENRCEEYILGAVSIIAKKNVSALDEGDLMAVAFLSESTWRSLIDRRISPAKLPTFSVHLRWFVETMKYLLHKTNGDVMTHPFGEFWVYLISVLIEPLPFSLQGNSFWELCSLHRKLFELDGINSQILSIQKSYTRFLFRFAQQNSQYWLAWSSCNARWFQTTWFAFSTTLEHLYQARFEENPTMRSALEDVRGEIESKEISQIQMTIQSELLVRNYTPGSSIDTFLSPEILAVWYFVHTQSYIHMLLAFVLDAPTFRIAVSSPKVVRHAPSVVLDAKDILVNSTNFHHEVLAIAVLLTVIATLVHPISQLHEGNSQCHFNYSLLL